MKRSRESSSRIDSSTYSWVLALVSAVWVLVLIAALLVSRTSQPPMPTPPAVAHDSPPGATGTTAATPPTDSQPAGLAVRHAAPEPDFRGAGTEPDAARLIESLAKAKPVGGTMTAEQANAWRQHLRQLIQLGPSAVPAIRAFLAQHLDFDFGRADREALGFSSARASMFDALAQIGGADAVNALSETLQATTDPQEIGLLARHLESLEPGTHQGEVLAAARQALATATEGSSSGGRDLAPLFELMQKFGDGNVVTDLQSSAGKWSFYATLALAQLADGAGIPALLQIASGPDSANSGARTAALEMLAQVATQSTEARAALVAQIRQGTLSAADLAAIAPMLAGDQLLLQNSIWDNALAGVNPGDVRKSFLPASNQSLFTAPLGASTPEQINERNALIDELLSATTDPASVQALQRARSLLLRRAPQVAASPGG